MFERNKINVRMGDAFVKVKGLDSVWKVDKILEFSDLPLHIRLVEQGGNSRTATVSYDTLMDAKFWRSVTTRRDAPTVTGAAGAGNAAGSVAGAGEVATEGEAEKAAAGK